MDWRDISTAPRDGTRILAWVCTRDSLRRGVALICWFVENVPDYGDTWVSSGGNPVDADAVRLWQPLPPPPTAKG